MRPVDTAFTEATGRYGDLRVGSKSQSRALLLMLQGWFSRSRSFRSFAHSGRRLLTPLFPTLGLPTTPSSCCWRLCRNSIILMSPPLNAPELSALQPAAFVARRGLIQSHKQRQAYGNCSEANCRADTQPIRKPRSAAIPVMSHAIPHSAAKMALVAAISTRDFLGFK